MEFNQQPLKLSPDRLIVLCDGATDAELFKLIKTSHPQLKKVPDANIRTYEQARFDSQETPLTRAVQHLHIDDRPDFIFCYNNQPVLVVEMTEHAYTGDNGLQRFARFAAAAENHVPFIYFGPLRRVRDDELDFMAEGTASARSLTSDVFQGMQRLAEIYKTPQLYVEWHTSGNGLPAKLGFRPDESEILKLYGELVCLIGVILFDDNPSWADVLKKYQENTTRLAGIINTRDSDVRITASPSQICDLIRNASKLCALLGGGNYFDKGKPDKLLAKLALAKSSITSIQLPDGSIIKSSHALFSKTFNHLLSHPKFANTSQIYYTGYKWRSDPHCGVLVNIDYRLCRSHNEPTPQKRATPLIVFYPRISCNEESETWKYLHAIGLTTPELRDLFVTRYGRVPGEAKMAQCLESDNLFSLWGNLTKQARLFRRYADVVVVNDGLILGHSFDDYFLS